MLKVEHNEQRRDEFHNSKAGLRKAGSAGSLALYQHWRSVGEVFLLKHNNIRIK